MNLGKGDNHQMVVATALIKRADLILFGVEDPLHSLTGGTNASHVVLGVVHILALLNLIAELSGILLQILDGLVLTHILAELIVSL